jgi:hypothetical protein
MGRPLSCFSSAASAAAALLALLACGPAAAVEAVTGAVLVMRIGPGPEHRSVLSVPPESAVTVHGCIEAEQWCLVRFAGRRGWVPGESLDVSGFSRPPAPPAAAAPQATTVVVVPVPVEAELLAHGIVSDEDVIVGIDEQFGLAARASLGKRGFHGGKRLHDDRLHFRKFGSRSGKPRFDRAHFGRSAIHPGKHGFDRLHFRKFGGDPDKRLRFGRLHHGGKSGLSFRGHRTGAGHGHHFKPGHHKAKFGKRARHGRSGQVGFSGFRVKGGWRP